MVGRSLRRRSLLTGRGSIQRIEYLESTGTQHIDTGIYGSNDIGFEATFQLSSYDSPEDNQSATILGARHSYQRDGLQLSTHKSGCTQVASVLYLNFNFDSLGRDIVVKLSGDTVYVNGAAAQSVNNITFSTPYTLHLFALRTNEISPGYITEHLRGKIKSVVFFNRYDESEILARFLPVRVGSEGCMLEELSGKVKRNAGSGSFICGPDI